MSNYNTLKKNSPKKYQINFILNKKTIKYIFSIVIIALMTTLTIFPDLFLQSFLNGLILYATAVLPALFPFMFLTKSLTDLGIIQTLVKILNKPFYKIFRAPVIGCYILFMSAICGYPVGAKLLSDLVETNVINKDQAEKLLPFSSTSGPIFIIGTVGSGMIGNKFIGFIIFGIHIAATIICAIIVGWITTLLQKNKTVNTANIQINNEIELDKILAKNMTDTCNSVLIVGGFIATFYLFIDILIKFKIIVPVTTLLTCLFTKLNIDATISSGISSGLIEMTRGCKDLLYNVNVTKPIIISLIGIITFSGISILIQSWAFLSKAKISFKKFFCIKILQTIIAIILGIIII